MGARAETVGKRARGAHSYVFCTRTVTGGERLWDGVADRLGGLAGANDARGTQRHNNAAVAWQMQPGDFSEDDTIRAITLIRAVRHDDDRATWAAREVLWGYGGDFWEDATSTGSSGD